MDTFHDIKDMLHEELREIVQKGELSAGSLDTIDKLLNSMKNACKLIMYEEYTSDGYSYADADMDMQTYSNARGRGSNARRDARGRYSSAGGNGSGNYSNRRGYSRRGYSYDDGEKQEKISMLHDMMQEVSSDEERRTLQKIIRRMEQE